MLKRHNIWTNKVESNEDITVLIFIIVTYISGSDLSRFYIKYKKSTRTIFILHSKIHSKTLHSLSCKRSHV